MIIACGSLGWREHSQYLRTVSQYLCLLCKCSLKAPLSVRWRGDKVCTILCTHSGFVHSCAASDLLGYFSCDQIVGKNLFERGRAHLGPRLEGIQPIVVKVCWPEYAAAVTVHPCAGSRERWMLMFSSLFLSIQNGPSTHPWDGTILPCPVLSLCSLVRPSGNPSPRNVSPLWF